jgi:recombinational DNA repair protein (RecF pathway)
MIFNENSGLVRIWVRRIQSGQSTLADVPDLGNLVAVVTAVVGE